MNNAHTFVVNALVKSFGHTTTMQTGTRYELQEQLEKRRMTGRFCSRWPYHGSHSVLLHPDVESVWNGLLPASVSGNVGVLWQSYAEDSDRRGGAPFETGYNALRMCSTTKETSAQVSLAATNAVTGFRDD